MRLQHYMKSLRILLVANADRRRLQGRWYSTEYKLHNGLTRAGHMVLFYSDRDTAREASFLPTKRLGIRAMNNRLVETARHYAPHLIIFGHADLCDGAVFSRLREALPGVRMAQVNVDPVHRAKTMAAFTARSLHLDRSFITTGDAKALASLAASPGTICFMPNPVDAAVETSRVFDAPADTLAWDGLFLGTGIEQRGAQLEYIARHVPAGYRFEYGGRAVGAAPLASTSFLKALTTGATAPNLPLDDNRPTPYLYSSDRIAQLLGQGVLAYTHAPASLNDLYDGGVVSWATRGELVEQMARYWRDDALRRRIAETGWRIAHERTSSERVATALVETVMEWTPSINYGWPTDPIA